MEQDDTSIVKELLKLELYETCLGFLYEFRSQFCTVSIF